ncbi:protein ABA AND ROS SENSITIVE 1 [Andrographis paniculata]|uniref:protein ABA AND ROS SENSITIVE 1 n=1 Tax=Andrographis paniculata TaxID=175694 RepID=UPI0021E6DCFC|nr:protein ABA AND ROS SENSITIVE 1 [Andrographis paniculata]
MDAKAKSKALFRAKLNAQKQEKQRIDSPFIRYEHDQPVCKVCDVVIKSESLWPAHQASRKHHEAIEKFKAIAAAANRPNNAVSAKAVQKSKPEAAKELPKPKSKSSEELNDNSAPSSVLPSHHSSNLPPDFFDNHDTKRQKAGTDSGPKSDFVPARTQAEAAFVSGIETDRSSTATTMPSRSREFQESDEPVSKSTTGSEAKQAKGALPEGFFDDKDADLRARGITPVKPDVKDEYKEFEKLIQEDLKEVDNRLEEEEFDAAEMIEEEETVEQRAYKERVETLRRKKLELRASKSAAETVVKKIEESNHGNEESSSSDDEGDDVSFKVDWRSKHL